MEDVQHALSTTLHVLLKEKEYLQRIYPILHR